MDSTCPYETCHKVFSTCYNLNTHIRVHHLQIKRFSCPICGHSFGYKHTMRKHQARHGHGRMDEVIMRELMRTSLGLLGRLLTK